MSADDPRNAKRRRPRDRGGQPPPDGWKEKFLERLEKSYLPTAAAKAAGVSRAYVYKVKAKDPEFAEAWQDALEKQTELLEQIAVRRAGDGSDTLLIFLLKSRRPEIYRENVHHDHRHQVNGQIGIAMLDGHDPVEFAADKRREAARLLLTGGDAGVIEGEAVDVEDAA